MKEVKAYIHVNRAADVVRALKKSGYTSLMVVDVKGTFEALDAGEQEYSTELGAQVITETKIELVCETSQLADVIELIKNNGKTGRERSGAIYVSDINAYHQF
ncbi:MAG: transcriptional regulator [Alphaproteobacteria bacterium]|nr:MAG: transcriptional regulator [Alphaproteobacteria bacterium]